MKNYLVILSLLTTISCFGQDKIDSLVQVGIQYHEMGVYGKAIEVYNEALKIDPKSTLANYEIALSYMYYGNYEKAIKHCDIVIKQKKESLLPAYITKGSALSDLGKIKQAIKVFKEGISKFGSYYLLHFNIGITYSKIRDTKNAEQAFMTAITDKSSHASSHYALAITEIQQNLRVQSLMCLYYFLLLEPSSKRAEKAYALLKEQLVGNVKQDKDNPMKVNVFLNAKSMGSEFSAEETVLSMLGASNFLEKNRDKTPDELFIENTKSFFSVLGVSEKKKKSNIWWNLYIPFFNKLAKSEYMDVFCYYISVSSNEKARDWIEANSEKVEKFEQWISE